MWREGDLRWKLDEHQQQVYDLYRKWERVVTSRDIPRRGMHRVFVMDISRRWGKTFLVALIFIEDLIRGKGLAKTYATAFMKDMEEIVIPMIEEICADAPDDVRPIYIKSLFRGTPGYRFPSSGSVLKLVGIDKNPRGLRGRASDGFAITEAGHVPRLAYTVGNVIYPQFQRRNHALMILESNAPEDTNHDFDRVFIPSAKRREVDLREAANDNGVYCYVFRDIDDNKAISEQEKQEFLDASLDIDPSGDSAQREYYGIRVRNPKVIVIPEFNPKLHVVPMPEMPEYCHAYTAMDPGEQPDPLALIWAYFDFDRAKLVIVRSYAQQNLRTGAAAELIKEVESDLWMEPRRHGPDELHPRRFKLRMHDVSGWRFEAPEGVTTYWDGSMFKPNPYKRVSDSEHRIVNDLAVEHGVVFEITDKGDKTAARNKLRGAFAQNRIEIVENSGPLADQLEHGRWKLDKNNMPTGDYERTKALGHLDGIDALIYLYRNVEFGLNPFPPAVTDKKASGVASYEWHADRQPTGVSAKLREAFGGNKKPNGLRTNRFR